MTEKVNQFIYTYGEEYKFALFRSSNIGHKRNSNNLTVKNNYEFR